MRKQQTLAHSNDLQAKINALPIAMLGDFVRELLAATEDELRPFFGWTLLAFVRKNHDEK